MIRRLLLASCGAVSFATPVLAQQSDPTELDEVIVTGSQVTLTSPDVGGQVARGGRVGLFGAMSVMDTPFNTTNYTEELARNQQTRSVGDVLQNDPAVRVTKGFGNFQELYVIRGFPVYSDDMTYNGLYGILPRQFVASEFLERVEVFHGATAFLNGAAPGGSGVGGAFNLTPKRAPNAPLNRLTAGVDGESELYLAADIARRFGEGEDYGARLNIARRDGEAGIEGEDRQLTVLGLGLDRRGDRARFSADLGYQDHHIGAPRPTVTPLGTIPAAPDASGNFGQPWTYTDEEQVFGVARGEFDISDSVSTWAAFGGRSGREENVLANPSSDAAGNLTVYRFDNAREDTIWSGDIGIRAELTTGSINHTLVASALHIQSKSKNAWAGNFGSFGVGTLANPVAITAPANVSFSGDLDDPLITERVRNTSFAVADMMSMMDDRLLVTIGARHQAIRTQTFDYNTGAPSPAYDSDAITPVAAVVFKPSDYISLYANYAEALIPGQIAPAQSGGLPVSNAGEVLDPFTGKQMEVGFKYDVGRLGGSVSLFRTTLASAYVDNGVFAANGEQENTGLEIAFHGEPRDGLRLLGGWTWLDAELTNTAGGTMDGLRPIGTPELQGNVNVEWDVPQLQGLTLEGRVIYTGSQPANAMNTVELDSWTRLDAGVRYEADFDGRPFTLRARVENLADENQWVAVGGYPGANYLTLGAPRTLRISLSADF